MNQKILLLLIFAVLATFTYLNSQIVEENGVKNPIVKEKVEDQSQQNIAMRN